MNANLNGSLISSCPYNNSFDTTSYWDRDTIYPFIIFSRNGNVSNSSFNIFLLMPYAILHTPCFWVACVFSKYQSTFTVLNSNWILQMNCFEFTLDGIQIRKRKMDVQRYNGQRNYKQTFLVNTTTIRSKTIIISVKVLGTL